MKGKAHFKCGLITTAGIAASSFLFNKFNLIECGELILAGTAASLLPDVDISNSILGRKIKPISKLINTLFGHRTLTHSGLWLIIWGILIINNLNNLFFPFILGGAIGFLSHLISDTMTRGGVPWAWPLNKKRYHLTNINSGEKDGIFIIMTAILINLIYFVYSSGFYNSFF